jgi:hypothetical protein
VSIRDNVYFDGDLPGPCPSNRCFVTLDLSDHPDSESTYRVKKDGGLYLEFHEMVGLRERLEAQGLRWQYPRIPHMELGLQSSFSGVVELWSDVAVYDAEFWCGRLLTVSLRDEQGEQ